MNDKETKIKLIQIVKNAIAQDTVLREKYQVVDKFRFIRDRLNGLLVSLEKELEFFSSEESKTSVNLLKDDEVIVFVHLFNAKGALLREWKNMVIPKVFYEYSINRPIYAEKSQIDAFIRAKPNKSQHAYLAIRIKKENILPSPSLQDGMGNVLLRVKEGSLLFSNLVEFTHNNIDYKLNELGDFIKKEE